MLSSYYAKNKIIEIQLNEETGQEQFGKYKVLDYKPLAVKLEIDLEQSGLKTVMADIFSRFPVKDITVNNISIKKVIKQIYEN